MAAASKSNHQGNPQKNPQKLGYPIIEKLIETEDFSKVNETVSACYDVLEKMLKSKSGGLKKQKAIRSALKAYDLTIDLIRELLKTKYELIRQHKAGIVGGQKK